MPTVQVPVELTVEHLMAVVKQLSPAELHEFRQQLSAWQQHNGQQAEEEAALLACIEENSHFPAAAQRRYEQLRRKRERGTLTEREWTESQALLQQLEARNVKRIEALIALAQRRGTTLRGIMAELGLHNEANVPSSSSPRSTDSPQPVNEGRPRRGRRGFPARVRQRSARA
jgi:hypothetical protein